MKDYAPDTYGDHISSVYDDLYGAAFDIAGPVALLAELAGDGRALELGIGTGRIALPLENKGVRVEGIDASAAMVQQLRGKPRGESIPVHLGDFAAVPAEGPFSLIYVVFNTFFALPTQEDQVRCFRGVAARLAPGGTFLIEAFVPDMKRFSHNQHIAAPRIEAGRAVLDLSRMDPVGQLISAQHVLITEGGIRLFPLQLRYAWPSELDLMAQLAGLRLRARYGGWQREPFTATSSSHISLYELPANETKRR